MNLTELFKDKSKKAKEKTEIISESLLNNLLTVEDVIQFSEKQKDPVKGTLVEALEYVTKLHPERADESTLSFVSYSLTEKAPRIKWESAKVIANIVHLFPKLPDDTISNLLTNANHEGTVVRWSAATALVAIIKAKGNPDQQLIAQINKIYEQEEKNSIKKIYKAVL